MLEEEIDHHTALIDFESFIEFLTNLWIKDQLYDIFNGCIGWFSCKFINSLSIYHKNIEANFILSLKYLGNFSINASQIDSLRKFSSIGNEIDVRMESHSYNWRSGHWNICSRTVSKLLVLNNPKQATQASPFSLSRFGWGSPFSLTVFVMSIPCYLIEEFRSVFERV